jgi:RNA polymerase-binding transcription factor DksA
MRDDLDRTIAVLQGERPGPVAGTGYPQDSADAEGYGQCVDCGHEIPEGRLDARPDAARCVGCQSKWAKRQR